MKLLKQNKCPDCGQITNERYRQMKMLNTRRWQQIQDLEITNAALETLLESVEKRVTKLEESVGSK